MVEEKPQKILKEEPQETPKEKPQKSPKEKPQKKPVVKDEEVNENEQVLKTINDSKKDLIPSLDSSDKKEKDEEEENNNKENENAENKENSGPCKKKSSNQWKPVLGTIIFKIIYLDNYFTAVPS